MTMTKTISIGILLPFGLALLLTAQPATRTNTSGGQSSIGDSSRWWSYVEFLASDKLEGRNTGSEGHRKAAEFVAAEFERDGLKAAGESGNYIQPVRFKTLKLDEEQSSLALIRDGKSRNITLGEEATIGSRVDPVPSIKERLIFVGYGLRVPEIGYDDFQGLDTKGKIAVYMAGAPSSL